MPGDNVKKLKSLVKLEFRGVDVTFLFVVVLFSFFRLLRFPYFTTDSHRQTPTDGQREFYSIYITSWLAHRGELGLGSDRLQLDTSDGGVSFSALSKVKHQVHMKVGG